MFGTVMMFGATGEIITERSGNLNLGVPGIMYLGAFSGFATAFFYEKYAVTFVPVVCIIISILSAFIAAVLGGLIYSFLTVTLRANQNVTGLTITIFGVGIGNFFGTIVMGDSTVAAAKQAYNVFSTKIPLLSDIPVVGELFFSYGFLVYVAIAVAIIAHLVLYKSKVGLNLRAVGENPATADAAGINITRYKYVATCLGAGICGLGGLYYVLDYGQGMWATENGIEALGWLAVALVIFTTWKSLNTIWGAILFGFLSWAYQFVGNLGLRFPNYAIDLVKTIPYVVTIIVLIFVGFRSKKESQGPASLGLPYFREER